MDGAAPRKTGPGSGRRTQPAGADSSLFDLGFDPPDAAAALLGGWRLQALMLLALVAGCLLLLLARQVASAVDVGAGSQTQTQWRAGAQGQVLLQASADPALHALRGQVLQAVSSADGRRVEVNALLLQRSLRWQSGDSARPLQQAQHQALQALVDQEPAAPLRLHFAGGTQLDLPLVPRGWRGLGPLWWPLCALALALLLQGAAVAMAAPTGRSRAYAVMCAAQAGGLVLVALGQVQGLLLPRALLATALPLHTALDLATAAAALQVVAMSAKSSPAARRLGPAGVVAAALVWVLLQMGGTAAPWWLLQGLLLALGAAAVLVLGRILQREPDPFVALQRRLLLAGLVLGVLISVAAALAPTWPAAGAEVNATVALLWHGSLAALLLVLPHVVRASPLLREMTLLTVMALLVLALHLGLQATLQLPPPTTVMLALGASLALYAGARPTVMALLRGNPALSTERMFDRLYRAARELQARPARAPRLMAQVLREMFEPLELLPHDSAPPRARVVGGGAELLVPLHDTTTEPGAEVAAQPPGAPAALRLRFAQRGRRLFTLEDARLAERVVDQLRRAAAFDAAVERGRGEERLRIAQDLHDDIGARLLTLMYQSPSPEMEDYLRHTLQDLKTLTRGLAASEHRLADAAGEWKADLTQRLVAAQVSLGWSFSSDRDLVLSMAQWSALTRVLRELASNALAHAQASRIDVQLSLQGTALLLTMADDGVGRAPEAWAHGLGLGGVRKRVKQLGGTVQWRELAPRGIVCEVRVPAFAAKA